MQIIQDNRFCSVEIQVHFISDANSNLSVRNIVKDMICDSSKLYNTKQKMRLKLDDMYGATLKSNSRISGLLHDISFEGSVIHDKFTLNQEHNIQDYLNFLKEIIFNPNFNETTFNEIKMRYIQRLIRLQEDIETYSIKEALVNAHPRSVLNVDPYGDILIIQNLTLDDVIQAYNNMISNDVIRVYIAGEVYDLDFISDRGVLKQASYVNSKVDYHETYVSKSSDQSFINLIYNTNTLQDETQFFIGLVSNVLLGGQDGLLFRTVREKHSLCYVVYSELYQYDGIALVHSGVNKTNIALALEKIKAVVNQVKEGDFSEILIDKAKTQIIHAMKIGNDMLVTKIGKLLNSELRNIKLDDSQKIEKINAVTKTDIMNYISKWEPLYLYVVEGEEYA